MGADRGSGGSEPSVLYMPRTTCTSSISICTSRIPRESLRGLPLPAPTGAGSRRTCCCGICSSRPCMPPSPGFHGIGGGMDGPESPLCPELDDARPRPPRPGRGRIRLPGRPERPMPMATPPPPPPPPPAPPPPPRASRTRPSESTICISFVGRGNAGTAEA